jgi:pyruvate-ferredoxin/flavodoxin oxidoreductase
MAMEDRFKMLQKSNPNTAKTLAKAAQADVRERWALYEYMANRELHN